MGGAVFSQLVSFAWDEFYHFHLIYIIIYYIYIQLLTFLESRVVKNAMILSFFLCCFIISYIFIMKIIFLTFSVAIKIVILSIFFLPFKNILSFIIVYSQTNLNVNLVQISMIFFSLFTYPCYKEIKKKIYFLRPFCKKL